MTKKGKGSGLIPFSERTPEEKKRICSMGGKAAAEKRALNRTFKDAMEWALNMPAISGNPTVDKIKERYPALNNRDAMAIAMTAKAIQSSDVKAFIAVRDTTGELPEQMVNVKSSAPMTISIKMLDDDEDEE